jgi:hypothetical protein
MRPHDGAGRGGSAPDLGLSRVRIEGAPAGIAGALKEQSSVPRNEAIFGIPDTLDAKEPNRTSIF